MSSITETHFEPSLPKLLSLDKDVANFEERLRQAAHLTGIPLEDNLSYEEIVTAFKLKSTGYGRAEWAIRWLLEKLKTSDGRENSRSSDLLFKFLERLLLVIPLSNAARLLSSNQILAITKDYLNENAAKLEAIVAAGNIKQGCMIIQHTADSESSVTIDGNLRPSRKRKRNEAHSDDGIKPSRNSQLGSLELYRNLICVISFFKDLSALPKRDGVSADPVASELIKSVFRTSDSEAAAILDAWFRCLNALFICEDIHLESSEHSKPIMLAHSVILSIWESRSANSNDDSTASPRTFSLNCLVSMAYLYARLTTELPTNSKAPYKMEFMASLEQLFARHVFIPGRASFSAATQRKRPSMFQAQTNLYQYLTPLGDQIARLLQESSTSEARNLIGILPLLLDQAVKLIPQRSTKQRAEEMPWIETTVAALSHCAGEPIPYEPLHDSPTQADTSPLPNLLHVIKERQVSLSSEFLESVLVGYSGLKGLGDEQSIANANRAAKSKLGQQSVASTLADIQKEASRVRWRLVAILLELGGNVFLKKEENMEGNQHAGMNSMMNQQPLYVEALMMSMADKKWDSGNEDFFRDTLHAPKHPDYPFSLAWPDSWKTAVKRIVIPLMKAYASRRNLSGFISLWFREVRRYLVEIGTQNEDRTLWASKELRNAFRDILEESLTPARINDHLIEFILPVKMLADDVAKRQDQPPQWIDLPATPPASAGIIILDAILYGVDREDTLKYSPPTWSALNDLMVRFPGFDMTGFVCGPRIWSILATLHTLSLRVEGEKSFLERQKALVDSSTLDSALNVAHPASEELRPDLQFLAAREAYKFIVTVCADMLHLPDLKQRAENLTMSANVLLLRELGKFGIGDIDTLGSNKNAEILKNRIRDCLQMLVRYPQTLLVFPSQDRVALFVELIYLAALESDERQLTTNDAEVSFRDLLEAAVDSTITLGSPNSRDDLVRALASILEAKSSNINARAASLAIRSFLTIPTAAITRKDRESILDTLSVMFRRGVEIAISHGPTKSVVTKNDEGIDIHVGFEGSETPLFYDVLALMTRLLEAPNPTAKLCTDAEIIQTIATRFDNKTFDAGESMPILQSLEALFMAILKQSLGDATIERRKKFTESFTRHVLEGALNSIDTANDEDESSFLKRLGSAFLLRAWLSVEGDHGDISDEVKRMAAYCHRTFLHDIDRIGRGEANEVQQKAIFHAISGFPYERLNINRNEVTHALDSIMLPVRNQSTEGGAINIIRVIAPGCSPEDILNFTMKQFRHNLSAQDHSLALRTFEHCLSTSRPQAKYSLLSSLNREEVLTPPAGNLQMLNVLIRSLTQDEASMPADQHTVFVRVCKYMESSTTIGQFGASMACINTILCTKPWLVTQFGIETLLSSLAIVASPKSRDLPTEHAGFIYLRLCHTTTNIILLHRKKLGSRMHLLIPLLRNLMICLFKPHRYQNPHSAAAAQPSWLSAFPSPLNAPHAVAYSRTLTTLCSPTVSSASSHRRNALNAGLVDETKKAREYAGQYVPYVLMHYCSLQLRGTVSAEVRERLRPGLWAMMDVVDIEGMRAMNLGLGRDERALWGGLYVEWKRFGRSKEK